MRNQELNCSPNLLEGWTLPIFEHPPSAAVYFHHLESKPFRYLPCCHPSHNSYPNSQLPNTLSTVQSEGARSCISSVLAQFNRLLNRTYLNYKHTYDNIYIYIYTHYIHIQSYTYYIIYVHYVHTLQYIYILLQLQYTYTYIYIYVTIYVYIYMYMYI